MYGEQLVAPHPLKHSDIEPVLLNEYIGFATLQESLERANSDPAQMTQATLEAVNKVKDGVSAALWYPRRIGSRNDYTELGIQTTLLPELITSQNQAADCFGYTIVASEYLSALGVKHYIGYANTHAFNLVSLPNHQLHLLDSLSPFNGSINDSLWGNSPHVPEELERSIETQIASHGRAALLVDSRKLVNNSEQPRGVSADSLALKYPWLKVINSANLDKLSQFNPNPAAEISKANAPYKLVTSIFKPETGRQMLENYMYFKFAMSIGNIALAKSSFEKIQGAYPELDARQSHHELISLVMALCVTDPKSAEDTTDEYFSRNFSLSSDSRILENKGTVLGKIARKTRSKRVAVKALQALEEAKACPHAFEAKVTGKAQKLRQFISDLSLGGELS